ncbi:protein cornichon homolog 4 [Morus notabilis]|uniref:protein cornichon homolog 4 n=1 Tax=Morus notabilis TaxID=981085 RepID=UPI000CED48D7|nr:protein cornichon homolog 4 [Morus notabilis]
MWALWTWLLSFFFILALLLILGFQLVCLVDLEYDYINPYDSASRINRVVLPEFITQAVLCFVLLVTGHWVAFLLSLPYLYYNVRQYMQGKHLVDVTEIYSQLNQEKNKRFFKMGYLIIVFIISLFWLLFTLGDEDD